MAEQIDLTTRDQAQPGTTKYRPTDLYLDFDGGRFYVILLGENGEKRQEDYRDGQDASGNDDSGSTIATDRMKALNTANLSTKSLLKRIMEMLINDGRLTGSISGTPD